MPEKDNKILKYNQGEKSMKVPFIICADLEYSLMNTYNNPEKSSITKMKSIYPLVIHCLHNVYLIQQKISLIVIGVKIP